jgi:hypothetical protein
VYAVLNCALGLVTAGKDSQVIVWGKDLSATATPQSCFDLKVKNEVHLWEGNATVRFTHEQTSFLRITGHLITGTESL